MTEEQKRYMEALLGKKTTTKQPDKVAEIGKEKHRMKVRLHDKNEVEMFRKLVDAERTCPQCGHVQPASAIPPEIQCLDAGLQFGYVEVVCPKCGNVQAILPMYDVFPSCVQEFEVNAKLKGIDPNTDKLETHLGEAAIDKLRTQVSQEFKGEEKADEAKQKYRDLL